MKYNEYIVYIVLVGILIIPFSPVISQDFYVSPSGNDKNDGSENNPFLTLHKAVQAVQEVFQADPAANSVIWMFDGRYSLSKPLVLTSTNLGNQNGSLTIRAVPGNNPILSGGVKITGWSRAENGIWTANLPDKFDQESVPRELFLDNQRAIRARHPNEGFLRVDRVGEDRRTNFFFKSGDFPIPLNPVGMELIFLHDWSISRIAVKSIDMNNLRLTAVDSIGPRQPSFFNLDHWETNPRYFLENDIRFLDTDYEWFIDPDTRKVSLLLPEGVDPKDLDIVVPYSAGLLACEGTEAIPLKNIHFYGLTFRHSAWTIPEKGYCGIQACHFDPRPRPTTDGWAVVPAAIKAEWSDNITFTNCTFSQLGGAGVWFGTGCRNSRISASKFSDISGNGIMIGEGVDRKVKGEEWWQSAPKQISSGNFIENTEVTNCGVQFYGAVGIWCGLTEGITIRNNSIHQLPYTGISIGWMWSPAPTPSRNNIIENNHIHHIMQTLSDGGGIYMLGLQPGSRIAGNHIHHVHLNAGRAESNGMFLDEGTTGLVVSNNLIHDIAKSPLRFHQATTNLVRQNLLFCEKGVPPIRYNSTREEDIIKENNHVFTIGEPNYTRALEKAIKDWETQ